MASGTIINASNRWTAAGFGGKAGLPQARASQGRPQVGNIAPATRPKRIPAEPRSLRTLGSSGQTSALHHGHCEVEVPDHLPEDHVSDGECFIPCRGRNSFWEQFYGVLPHASVPLAGGGVPTESHYTERPHAAHGLSINLYDYAALDSSHYEDAAMLRGEGYG
jgi:hypothetical protein